MDWYAKIYCFYLINKQWYQRLFSWCARSADLSTINLHQYAFDIQAVNKNQDIKDFTF